MKKHKFSGWTLLVILLLIFVPALISCGEPTPTEPPSTEDETTTGPTTAPTIIIDNPSDVTTNPDAYNEKTIELTGQALLPANLPGILLDSRSGIILSGNIAGLEKTYYHVSGVYDADSNTLNVAEFGKEQVDYLPVDTGQDINLVPVSVQGLIANPPKEVGDILKDYITIASTPQDVYVHPYVVYAREGLFLALYDSLLNFPTQVAMSAGEVKGTLVKTPMEEVQFGPSWQSGEFDGVVIANSMEIAPTIPATVEEINNSPDNYMFKRVSLEGSYLSTAATISYSDQQVVLGQGILASSFTSFFEDNTSKRIETIDPTSSGWRLRQCQVTGTIIGPTEAILTYLNYAAPLSNAELTSRQKPAFILEAITDKATQTVDITDLYPSLGKSSQYWGKAVGFEGWLLGVDIPIKNIAPTINNEDLATKIELVGVGVAKQSSEDTQLVVIGLRDDLKEAQGLAIYGKYDFAVAANEMQDKIFNIKAGDTALFLLDKNELAVEVPTENYHLAISLSPPWGGKVEPGEGPIGAGTRVALTAIPLGNFVFDHWGGDASGTSPTTVIIMNSDKLVYAYFDTIKYNLEVSVTPEGSGSVTINPLLDAYEADSAVSLAAYPVSGYVFDYWSGDATSSTYNISVLMDSDKSVTAHFKQVK